ncbi:hypothetical protein [Streptomyces sp. SA15]|uniref:hypothetical protein n=1 Tax=Streptomyces sp. SA15 TaxID=934019 RepID=UPI00211CF6AD|nr:hypothetical protein [Streptomyces sp. SA15]
MPDAMIRVAAEVHDQLAAVAKARRMSLRALVQEIAAQTLTPEQIKERADRTRTLLAERFGHYVTDEESAEMRRKMREAAAAHRAALAEAEPTVSRSPAPGLPCRCVQCDVRLWAPVLRLREAERERTGFVARTRVSCRMLVGVTVFQKRGACFEVLLTFAG